MGVCNVYMKLDWTGLSFELGLEALEFEKMCQNHNHNIFKMRKTGLKPTLQEPSIFFKESKLDAQH
jgi:hypothetical protein